MLLKSFIAAFYGTRLEGSRRELVLDRIEERPLQDDGAHFGAVDVDLHVRIVVENAHIGAEGLGFQRASRNSII